MTRTAILAFFFFNLKVNIFAINNQYNANGKFFVNVSYQNEEILFYS